ncbi:FHA domain-containing protein [Rugosimonospora acidiphila]|uniref:FHA domain-containing protein n=1 Tax=Rugosimonospora acidiphila TaxID=556531 RepID=UPI0031EA6583
MAAELSAGAEAPAGAVPAGAVPNGMPPPGPDFGADPGVDAAADAGAGAGAARSDGAPAGAAGNGAGAQPRSARPDGSLPSRDPAPASAWRVAVSADRDYHARMQALADPEAEPIAFPVFCPERRFSLQGPQMLIGRQSRSRGIEPDIDLTGPPVDPAVSHAHAMLVAQPDGAWALVDLGSANGTYLNDRTEPVEENVAVPLSDGDRIHVGAFSTLTLHRI